jgi:hypothetical protein
VLGWLACLLVLLAGGSGCRPRQDSDSPIHADSPIRDDEEVIFFPTLGRLSADGSTWVLDLHGWIFEREEGSWIRGGIHDLFVELAGLDMDPGEEALFRKRAGLFLADNERGKEIAIRVGEQVHRLEASEANGHFRGTLNLSRQEAARLASPAGAGGASSLAFQAVTPKGDERRFRGTVHLLEPEGVSVISDIDDTIKVSEVGDTKALLRNTFLRDFRAVPGMADLYRRWAKQGASFHYLTASQWQLYEPLAEFIAAEEFPAGTFHMKLFRLKDDTRTSLFTPPSEHKLPAIQSLVEAYPRRRFILVGDAGEADPEIFGKAYHAHPGRIDRLLIRDVTGGDGASARYQEAFKGVPPEKWQVFAAPEEVRPWQ